MEPLLLCAMGIGLPFLLVLGIMVLYVEPKERHDLAQERLAQLAKVRKALADENRPTVRPPVPAMPLPRKEPRDSRWAHADTLVAELRADADTAALADDFEGALRTLFGRLERLASSEEAHEASGRAGRVERLRQDVEARLAEVLHALGDVHLRDLSSDATADFAKVDGLLARVRADAEVDSALATPRPPPERGKPRVS